MTQKNKISVAYANLLLCIIRAYPKHVWVTDLMGFDGSLHPPHRGCGGITVQVPRH